MNTSENYTPSGTLNTLKKVRQVTIMVFVPKYKLVSFSDVLEGIMEESQNLGHHTLVHLFDGKAERWELESDLKKNADGILVLLPSSGENSHEIIEVCYSTGVPLMKYQGERPLRGNKKKSRILGNDMCRTLIGNIVSNIAAPACYSKI